MLYALIVPFLVLLALCALLNLLTLPGNWIMVALVALWAFFGPESGTACLGLSFFLFFLGLALAGELIEFLSQIWGGKKYGSSNSSTLFGIVGAIAGAILCAPFLFGLGAILGGLGGAWLGCFLSERLLESKSAAQAIRAANGALLGRFLGMVVKFGLGVSMVALTASYVWPH